MESAWPSHRHAGSLQFAFQLSNVLQTEVEDGSSQSRVRAPVAEDVNEMLRRPGAPRRDYRDGNRIGHHLRQLAFKTGLRAIAVHGRKQDLPRATGGCFAGPLQRVAPGGPAPSGNEYLEAPVSPPCIDGHYHRLRAKTRRNPPDQL